MSIVSEFTNTTALTAGQNFVSAIADLKTFNSLTSQVYLEWVGGSEITSIVFLYSSDGVNFDTRNEFIIQNGIGQNLSMPIHARYCKYEVSHLGATDMNATRITAAVHEEVHQNIDVNVNLSDTLTATITNPFNLEATQQQVKALQETGNASLTSIDSKIVTCDTDDVGDKLDTLSTQATTQIGYLTSIDSKITEVNTGDVSITSSVLPVGASTSALQTTGNDYLNGVVLQTTDTNAKLTTANATLDNIKTNTDNLVRVTPTTNVTEAIPVRLMVGTAGSAFNALRSIGSDLGVYVDDMNVDAVNNSGMAKASLQTDGNNTLSTISNTLTTMDGVLDNIETGINKAVTTDVLYNNATVTSGTTTSAINMGTGKDRYNTIQVIGSSSTNGFDFRFHFSIDGTNWYSDGVFSSHYHNGSTYEFAVSRLNISVPYIRMHVGSTSGNNVYMSYALSKE
jgi:hypothetical protein